MSKILSLAAAGTVLALAGGSLGAAQAFAKDVTLVVDGVPSHVKVLDATVAQVLTSKNISLSANDVVSPSVNERVADGSQITVSYARPVTMTVDGTTQTRWTTARTVADALAQFALRAENGRLSVSRSMEIGREGAAFDLQTAKNVAVITKDGQQNLQVAGTVADALAAAGVTVDENDKVSEARDTALTEGMVIYAVRVEVRRVSAPLELDYTTETKQTDELAEGETKVQTPGVKGQVMEIWEEVVEDGVAVFGQKVGEESRTEPVNEVVLVGTKVAVETPAPAPAAAAAAPAAAAATTQAAAPAATTTRTTTATAAPVAAAPVASYSGSHADWMAAAGISPADYQYVEWLIARESGWNPNAVNPSSGACGLVQALPCSKLGSGWNNPVVALQWANGYVSRYGGWAGAWAHSQAYGWY